MKKPFQCASPSHRIFYGSQQNTTSVSPVDGEVENGQRCKGDGKPLGGDRDHDENGNVGHHASRKLDDRLGKCGVHDVHVRTESVENAACWVGVEPCLGQTQDVCEQLVVKIHSSVHTDVEEGEGPGQRKGPGLGFRV